MRLLRALPLLLLAGISGCASSHYKHTDPGNLHGTVTVSWDKPNIFVYEPDPSTPLTFTRKSDPTITPAKMYTDGGSIPRAFWVFRNYSPWGYGPAFIVHDWLFHMQNCKFGDYKDYTLKEAATVMSEVMRTLMETPDFDYGSKTSMYLMYEAVQTPPAREAWEHGKCITPDVLAVDRVPDATIVIHIP